MPVRSEFNSIARQIMRESVRTTIEYLPSMDHADSDSSIGAERALYNQAWDAADCRWQAWESADGATRGNCGSRIHVTPQDHAESVVSRARAALWSDVARAAEDFAARAITRKWRHVRVIEEAYAAS